MQYEISCGAVVFTRVNGAIRYVIVQSLEGYYGFPKGHMEPGETEEATALREIREEVGLQPRILADFRTGEEHSLREKPGVMKRVIYFLAEYADQEIVYQKEELMGARLMSYEEAMGAFQFESSKRNLTEANDFLQAYAGKAEKMDFEKLDAVAASLMKERKVHLDREKGSVYYHGQRVAKLALTLREMVCPEDDSWDDRLRLAAMFHDIGKGVEPHQRFGPPLFLEAVKGLVDEADAQDAARLIAAHCDRRPEEPVHDVWARLIQDADLLDHLGTYNIWMDMNYYSHRWQGVDELREYMLENYDRYYANNRKKINFDVSKRIFDDKLEFVFEFIRRLDKESRGEFYRIPQA